METDAEWSYRRVMARWWASHTINLVINGEPWVWEVMPKVTTAALIKGALGHKDDVASSRPGDWEIRSALGELLPVNGLIVEHSHPGESLYMNLRAGVGG